MFSFVKSLVIPNQPLSALKELDISTWQITDVLALYRKVFLILTNPALTGVVTVDLDDLLDVTQNANQTVLQALTDLGSRAVAYSPGTISVQTNSVKFTDLFRAGFDPIPVDMLSPDSQKSIYDSPDVVLSRPGDDPNFIFRKLLVCVNGFFHYTDCDGTRVFVQGATRSLIKSDRNRIGAMSFGDVANITLHKLSDAQISGAGQGSLYTRTYIDLQQDMSGKTAMLVVGGYIYFMDGQSFWQVNDSIYGIDFTKVPYVERHLESRQYLDFTSLGLSVNTNNPNMIDLAELTSDAVVRKLLKHDQSFVVVVDKPNLFFDKTQLESSNFPYLYTSYFEPIVPIFYGYGRCGNYWKTREDKRWCVNIPDSVTRDFLYTRSLARQSGIITDTYLGVSVPRACAFNIGVDTFTYQT